MTSNKPLLRTSATAIAILTASLTAGCYVVPMQTQTGQAPAYAYSTIPPAIVQAPPPGPAQPASLHVRLYPVNDTATQQGALHGVVADTMAGRGTFTLAFGGGQMQGEATRVAENYPGFGRVFRDVLGGAPANVSGARRGIANAYGSNGLYANCEYVLTAPAIGTGVCAFSNGAKYQIHFGG